MMNGFDLYFIARADSVKQLLAWSSVGFAVLFLAAVLSYSDQKFKDADDRSEYTHGAFMCLVVAASLCCVNTLIPTTKELCAMTVIPRLSRGESVEAYGNKIIENAESWMEENSKNNGVIK